MAKFIKLNPYQNIQEEMDAFFQRNYLAIQALSLREDPTYKGKIREMALSKLIKNTAGQGIGILNVHVLNNKYETLNQKTNRHKVRFPQEASQGVDVNPEHFTTEFVDDKDMLNVRLSFSQFESHAMALAPVKFSVNYNIIAGEDRAIENALRTREVISHMWEDAAMVLVTREFFEQVAPILSTWAPVKEDVTVQTLFVQ